MLLLIIENADIKIDYDYVAEKLSHGDVTCTPKAVMRRFQKVKAGEQSSVV